MMKKLFAIGLVTLLMYGCSKNDDAGQQQTCTYDSCAVKAPASEIQAVQAYLASKNITATQHCSGLFYRVETVGTGNVVPSACSFISAKYKGSLTNGNVFDQTTGASTLDYPLSNLIKGWINGLPYIRSGGKIHLYVPPTLGYGPADQKNGAGVVVIPGNSVLIFEVELVNVQ
ncbi:MAG TPA: FKBP-type peptidyl-prolyl cis-trans isomerase [Chitinophagaceae bacterium]|nr:FKBP-type peptidyl-prolyl cis-trans isomerase [Chitinophagaceae bacterium]